MTPEIVFELSEKCPLYIIRLPEINDSFGPVCIFSRDKITDESVCLGIGTVETWPYAVKIEEISSFLKLLETYENENFKRSQGLVKVKHIVPKGSCKIDDAASFFPENPRSEQNCLVCDESVVGTTSIMLSELYVHSYCLSEFKAELENIYDADVDLLSESL